MFLNAKVILRSIVGAAMAYRAHGWRSNTAARPRRRFVRRRTAQTPAPPAPLSAAAPTWSVGPMDLSGFIDGYYSFNFNRPNTTDGYDQTNQLYNFNDKTDHSA